LSPANPNLAQEGTRNTADNDNTFDEQDETPQIPSTMSLTYLKKFFGFSKFRPLQYEIIDAALNKRDQLVVMSTGYGKSICYQMPSLIAKYLTLVISPLISLMEDQVNALK